MEKKILCMLSHLYIHSDGLCKVIKIEKFIGLFSSTEKAEKVIAELIEQPGFKDYPRKSFIIRNYLLNVIDWKRGFKTIEDEDVKIS